MRCMLRPESLSIGFGCLAAVAVASLGSGNALVGKVVGRVGLGSADVGLGELWVVANDVGRAVARPEQAQDVFNCDARIRHDGLAHYDVGVALDAWLGHRDAPVAFQSSIACRSVQAKRMPHTA